MLKKLSKALALAACAASLGFMSVQAHAEDTLKIGALRADAMIRIYYADEKGYFKDEGIKADIMTLGSGPAVSAALASGSVDVGYAAIIPVIKARASHQPFQVFATLDYEYSEPDRKDVWIVTSGASKVGGMADLRGKTVAINGASSACDLMLRDHLAKAGVAYEDVKKIIVPFPQMPAMLQMGNADAACVSEPEYATVKLSPKIRARAIAAGMLAEMQPGERMALDVLYTRADWGQKNEALLRRFLKALERASADFRADRTLYPQQLMSKFEMAPALARAVTNYFDWGDLTPTADSLQPLINAMAKEKLIDQPIDATQMILPIK